MAISKVGLMEPLQETELDVNQRALVVGGGISGMTAAKSLAIQGYETHLVEKDSRLGGQARHLYHTATGEDVQDKLAELIRSVESDPKIHLHLNSTLSTVDGFVGNFETKMTSDGAEEIVEHGVAVMATGASELKPVEYGYGEDSRIITGQEFDKKLIHNDPSLDALSSAVFIQCVGSREPDRVYCSRICCTHTMMAALELKHRNPDISVFVLYRDIRTYGVREAL